MPAALPESPRPSAAGPGGARSRSPSPRHRTHILRGGGGVQSCSPLARRARVDGTGGGITPFLRTARPPLTSPDPGRHLRGESCRRGPARPGRVAVRSEQERCPSSARGSSSRTMRGRASHAGGAGMGRAGRGRPRRREGRQRQTGLRATASTAASPNPCSSHREQGSTARLRHSVPTRRVQV